MNLYKHTGNIKAGLFILGIALIIGLLTYTQSLVNELRNDNRQIVRLYAEIIANIVQDDNDANLDFVFENIIQIVYKKVWKQNYKYTPFFVTKVQRFKYT